jgi:lipopolysaccharide export system permease protein
MAPSSPASTRANVYVSDGPNVLYAESVAQDDGTVRMKNVTWYGRDATGMITSKIVSPAAVYAHPGWRIDAGQKFDVASTVQTDHPLQVIARGVTPEQVEIANVDADALNLFPCPMPSDRCRPADAPRRADRQVVAQDFRAAGSMLMPLLGAVAAFGLARSGALLVPRGGGDGAGLCLFRDRQCGWPSAISGLSAADRGMGAVLPVPVRG